MLLSGKRSEGCTKDDWTCNLEKRKNERPNGKNGEKESHVHIEKLNLPCRYFFAHSARFVYPKCMVYAHLLVHSYSLVKTFMLILWCKGSDVNYLFLFAFELTSTDTHTHAPLQARCTNHSPFGHLKRALLFCSH